MKYYKTIINGYITMITTEHGQTEITDQEYKNIKRVIENAPIGNYALTESLKWVHIPIEGATVSEVKE